MNAVLIFLLVFAIGAVANQPKTAETFLAVSKPYIEEYGEPLSVKREHSSQLGFSTIYYYWGDKYVVFYRNRYRGSDWTILEEGENK